MISSNVKVSSGKTMAAKGLSPDSGFLAHLSTEFPDPVPGNLRQMCFLIMFLIVSGIWVSLCWRPVYRGWGGRTRGRRVPLQLLHRIPLQVRGLSYRVSLTVILTRRGGVWMEMGCTFRRITNWLQLAVIKQHPIWECYCLWQKNF